MEFMRPVIMLPMPLRKFSRAAIVVRIGYKTSNGIRCLVKVGDDKRWGLRPYDVVSRGHVSRRPALPVPVPPALPVSPALPVPAPSALPVSPALPALMAALLWSQ